MDKNKKKKDYVPMPKASAAFKELDDKWTQKNMPELWAWIQRNR